MSDVLILVKRFDPEDPRAFVHVELPHAAANLASGFIETDPSVEPFSLPVYPGGVGQDAFPGIERGDAGFARLSAIAAVGAALDQLTQSPGEGSLFVRVFDSDTLPWEALRHPDAKFLALDPQNRWGLARIPGSFAPPSAPRELELPLRVSALLCAAQVDARPELDALHAALTASGIDFRLAVHAAHLDVVAHATALGDARVTAAPVPASEPAIVERLALERPHLLHVLAHGKWIEGSAYLEIATLASHDGTAAHHVYLAAGHLVGLGPDLLIKVLNACNVAEAADDGVSLAFQLVHDGLPAAIGMRDVIDVNDARRFTRSFYAEAGKRLAALAPGVDTPFRWEHVVGPARVALCQKHGGPTLVTAGKRGEWTLPVLYVRHPDARLRLRASGLAAEARPELETTLAILRAVREASSPALGTGVPADRLAKLDAMIAGLEAKLGGAPGAVPP